MENIFPNYAEKPGVGSGLSILSLHDSNAYVKIGNIYSRNQIATTKNKSFAFSSSRSSSNQIDPELLAFSIHMLLTMMTRTLKPIGLSSSSTTKCMILYPCHSNVFLFINYTIRYLSTLNIRTANWREERNIAIAFIFHNVLLLAG